MKKIDLADFRSPGIRVFAGRARGESVRHALDLDAFDKLDDEAEILVPVDVFSVNSSFFLGMFAASIRFLGREKFLQKYKIVSGNLGPHIVRAMLDAVRDVSDTGNPLSD